MRDFYKTIVISDIQLGEKLSKVKALNNFLKHHKCEHLIINGRLFGDNQSIKSILWKKKHLKFFATLQKMMDEDSTTVTIIKGINDQFDTQTSMMIPKGVKIVNELIIESADKKYFVIHGDIYDNFAYRQGLFSKMNGNTFSFLSWISKNIPGIYFNGQSFSVGELGTENKYADFERYMAQMAAKNGCDGVICGHTHVAAIKKIDGIDYFNSGDWITSFSALVETTEKKWNLCFNAASKLPSLKQKLPAKANITASNKNISAA